MKNRFLSKPEQIKLLTDAIQKQEEKYSRIVAGKLRPIVEKGQAMPEDKDWEKVNKITEDCRLRILKVTKFTLENEGEGSFEQIELDGMRCITYIAQDSHLTPIYIKVPNDPKSNEPITMYKDESLKRKYQKEATDIITADYMESMNDNVSKTLSLVAKVLLVILVLGNIFLFMSNLNRTKEIDEERNLLLEEYKNTPAGVCNEAVSIATKSITGQIANNGVLIDYAKKILSDEINKTKVSKTPENSNIVKI